MRKSLYFTLSDVIHSPNPNDAENAIIHSDIIKTKGGYLRSLTRPMIFGGLRKGEQLSKSIKSSPLYNVTKTATKRLANMPIVPFWK